MLQLDISGFVCAVAALPGQKNDKRAPLGLHYLNAHVVLPLLNGNAVRLDELDFDAFDEDDISALRQSCEDEESCVRSMQRLFAPVTAAAPVARSVGFV